MSQHVRRAQAENIRETESPGTLRPGGTSGDRLLRLVDYGLLGVIFIAPLFLGGRHDVGRLVFVALTVGITIAWLVRQSLTAPGHWVRSPADWLLPAGALVLVVQMAPLPASLHAMLSPGQAELLPLWSDPAASLGGWNYASLAPAETRGGLVMVVAYSMLFLIAVQRIQSIADVERILRWIGLSAVLMAVLGLLQHVAGNGKFLWIYEHPFRDANVGVHGAFINRNHFAHMLALGIGPLAIWLAGFVRRPKSKAHAFGEPATPVSRGVIALGAALGVVLFAGLLSVSRAGSIAIVLATCITTAVLYRAGWLRKQYAWSIGSIMGLVLAALLIYGFDRVVDRLDDLSSGSLEVLDHGEGRRIIWAANVAAFRDHPLLGTGAGTHRQVYRRYVEQSLPFEFSHAESGYLQIASETGAAGLLLLCVGIVLPISWCVRAARSTHSHRLFVVIGAVAAGIVASVVHSTVDFVWYIPACMSITVLLVACALRLFHLSALERGERPRTAQIARPLAYAFAAAGIVAGAAMVHERVGPAVAAVHWDRFLRTKADFDQLREKYPTGNDAAPSDLVREALVDVTELRRVHLENVVRWDPEHFLAQSALANTLLQQFSYAQEASINPMPLNQIRDAALQSNFASRGQLDAWLAAAVGENRKLLDRARFHARRALRSCPLEGDGYLVLSELCFLEGAGNAAKTAFVRQALSVWPHDGDALFEAGREAIARGDVEQAFSYWKRSFAKGGRHEREIIALLAGHVPISFFIETFDPRLSALRILHNQYQASKNVAEFRPFLMHYASALETAARQKKELPAALLWLEAQQVYDNLERHDRALACIEQALLAAPNHYKVHLPAGRWYLAHGRFAEAEKHLKWCSVRNSGDRGVHQMLRRAVEGRVERSQPQVSTERTNSIR